MESLLLETRKMWHQATSVQFVWRARNFLNVVGNPVVGCGGCFEYKDFCFPLLLVNEGGYGRLPAYTVTLADSTVTLADSDSRMDGVIYVARAPVTMITFAV
jgi:hypothetical protein